MRRITRVMKIAALLCTLLVTNTNDEGAGSLRAALEETLSHNRAAHCTITFQIPGDGPWHTIRPRTPLPQPPGFVTIDATTQPDTNPHGPEVELNGAEQTEGSGLRICAGTIRGLAINGFPANGITLTSEPPCSIFPSGGTIAENYIGTDPTGTRAVPNARGVWLAAARWTELLKFLWTVENNVISGNRYSGVFVGLGSHLIRNNIIGTTSKGDAPLGNGSSGVAVLASGWGTDVDDNHIAFNGHFGIGLAPGAWATAMHGNSFYANGQLAIDYGFNGPSPGGIVETFPGIPAAPVITSARYENGVTTIEGTAPPCPGSETTVTLYANDAPDPSGYGEGQYLLGTVNTTGTFTVRHPGNLRGQWVAATFRCGMYYAAPIATNSNQYARSVTTSEFSRAVEVK